jgi:hypothetical protein
VVSNRMLDARTPSASPDQQRGMRPPLPLPSPCKTLASGIDHAVEDGDADGCLGLLAGQFGGRQGVAEDALVACHRGFRLPPAVVGFPLPAQSALVGKGLDVAEPKYDILWWRPFDKVSFVSLCPSYALVTTYYTYPEPTPS